MAKSATAPAEPGLAFLKLIEITPDPNQPRKFFDKVAMDELIDSVREKGVLQPILVRPAGDGFLLVCGERRYRAAVAVNGAIKERNTIPAVIRDLSDEEALELQIIENLQRKDVHPMEEAVAFKSLLDKGKDVKEIAIRVGKSEYYARQRIKLCDLISDWQTAYYSSRIDGKTATILCLFDAKIQAEMFKERGSGTGNVDLGDWFFRKYRGELLKASFDLADPSLEKKMGPCTTCIYNSAVSSLFPEAASNPKCSKISCYKAKSDAHFTRALKEAKADPEIILVNTEYSSYSDNMIKQLEKEKCVILNGRSGGGFSVIPVPIAPDLEDYDIEDYDSEEDRNRDHQQDIARHYKDLQDYQDKISGGRYKKAFSIHGDDKGKIVYIQINKAAAGSSKNTKSKEQAGKLTIADVEGEITRIQAREKRAKELDMNNIHKETLEQLEKARKVLPLDIKHQGKVDQSILVYLLIDAAGFNSLDKLKFIPKEPPYHSKGYAFDYFKKLGELNQDQIAAIVRAIAFNKWGSKNFQHDVHKQDTTMRLIAEYIGVNLGAIEAAQKEISDKRQEKVNKRIAALQVTKKELHAAAKPAKVVKPKAVKK